MKMNRLYFLHIPKCAGTAVGHMLAQQFAVGEVMHVASAEYRGIPSGYANPGIEVADRDEIKPSHKLVIGHFSFGIHGDDQVARYVTVLRDPVERALSHYGQFQRNATHGRYHGTNLPTVNSVWEWLDVFPGMAFNLQTRLMRGKYDHSIDPFRYRDAEPMTRTDVDVAKANLAKFTVVGVYERLGTFLRGLEAAFGWNGLVLGHEHAGHPRPRRWELSPKTVLRIEECNAMDYEWYDHAIHLP